MANEPTLSTNAPLLYGKIQYLGTALEELDVMVAQFYETLDMAEAEENPTGGSLTTPPSPNRIVARADLLTDFTNKLISLTVRLGSVLAVVRDI